MYRMHRKTGQSISLTLSTLAVLLLVASGSKTWAQGRPQQTAIPVRQIVASINTAVKAKPGNVGEVAVQKSQSNKTLCKVTIIARDGKKYEVTVDVKTNKAVKVEAV